MKAQAGYLASLDRYIDSSISLNKSMVESIKRLEKQVRDLEDRVDELEMKE